MGNYMKSCILKVVIFTVGISVRYCELKYSGYSIANLCDDGFLYFFVVFWMISSSSVNLVLAFAMSSLSTPPANRHLM